LNVQRHPLGARGIVIKNIMDYVFATLAIVILAPLFAVIALAIKLDSPGPVFFVQARTGYRLRVINVFKFRSMTVLEDGPVVTQAQRGDLRVTRVGRFLRRTSLTIAAAVNAARRARSLGPHAAAHDKHYSVIVEQYASREIKPGSMAYAGQVLQRDARSRMICRALTTSTHRQLVTGARHQILFRTIGVVLWIGKPIEQRFQARRPATAQRTRCPVGVRADPRGRLATPAVHLVEDGSAFRSRGCSRADTIWTPFGQSL
jgi:lipopolysaccharide/colanic/teichoic acid biosynthesis glycosyltransferase